MSQADDWAKSVRAKTLDKITEGDGIVFLAATATMNMMYERWGHGGLTNGGKMTYKDDYELWAYKPPSPAAVSGKGKPYEDWIVRPESISERRDQTSKSLARATKMLASAKAKRNAATTDLQIQKAENAIFYWETRGELSGNKSDAFKKRFGKKARNIKGGYYANYSAYKEGQGRADLPFELTGDLRLAWFNGAKPTPHKVSPLICTITLPTKQFKKAEGLAEMKGEFLKLNDAERAFYTKRCNDLLSRP